MADRDREEIWGSRADRLADEATYHPWRLGTKIIVALIALAIIFGVIGLIGGWFSGTANLTSFDHTKEQTTAVLDDWTSLQAAACNAKGATDSKAQAGDPTLVEDPALAYKATYRRIAADYDRRMANFFEAKITRHIPIPGSIGGLPEKAPSLADGETMWC